MNKPHYTVAFTILRESVVWFARRTDAVHSRYCLAFRAKISP